MSRGVVYCMSCIVPGLVKIGKSAQYKNRMYDIKHNGYVNVTGFKEEYAIEVEDHHTVESELHEYFKDKQIGNTELYAVTIDQAIMAMSKYNGKQIFPNPNKETKNHLLKSVKENIKSSKLNNGTYYLKSNKYHAELEVCNGILTLKKGSTINQKPTTSFFSSLNKKNPKLWEIAVNEYCVDGILLDDFIVPNVSAAACIVLGNSVNGWNKWVDKDGILIDAQRKDIDS